MKLFRASLKYFLFVAILGCASSLELPQYNSALEAYKDGKYQTSLTYINQALDLDDREPQFYILRAKANYKIGNKLSAMEDLDKSLELGGNFSAYHLKGKLYLERSDIENASLNLRKAYSLNPQSADLLFDIGYLEYLNGDMQLALNYYSTAAKYDSRNPKTYVNIGNIYSMLGNSKSAIDHYSKALVLDTTDGVAFFSRANEKMMLNDIYGAIEDYNSSLQIDSMNTQTLFMLAEANNKVGDIKSSLMQYNSIINIDSTASRAYYLRGIAEITFEEFDKACKDFVKAGELGYFDAYEMSKKYCDKKLLQKKKKTKK